LAQVKRKPAAGKLGGVAVSLNNEKVQEARA
jgi:hypothetical protein